MEQAAMKMHKGRLLNAVSVAGIQDPFGQSIAGLGGARTHGFNAMQRKDIKTIAQAKEELHPETFAAFISWGRMLEAKAAGGGGGGGVGGGGGGGRDDDDGDCSGSGGAAGRGGGGR